MKQLSNLTKIMFCIVAVLLVITVALGIATAIKDNKENQGQQGQKATVTPIPDATGGATKAPDNPNNTPGADHTPAPTDTPTPTVTPEPTAKPKHVVAIDPGQQKSAVSEKEPIGPGAEETKAKMSSGATSVTTGKKEYEWTLLFSKKLKAELEARGYGVVMTHEEADVKISNAERAKMVNASDAEIYVSIQADAVSNETANGIFAQIPSKANPFVPHLYTESKALAKLLHGNLIKETAAYDRGLREYDDLATINYSEIPVTILQLGFMSNPEEDAKLWSEDYQNKMVKAICDGIDAYFGE